MLRVFPRRLPTTRSNVILNQYALKSRFTTSITPLKEVTPTKPNESIKSSESTTNVKSSSTSTTGNNLKADKKESSINSNAKPKAKKSRFRKLKFITSFGLVFGASIVGGGIYTSQSKDNDEYAEYYRKYMPQGEAFLKVMERNDNNTIAALTEISTIFVEDLQYSADFIVKHFNSLKNMIQHNEWDQSIKAPETEKSVTPAKIPSPNNSSSDLIKENKPVEEPKVEREHFSNPVNSIQLNVDIPAFDSIEPLVTELSLRIKSLVQIINKLDLSRSHLAEIRDLTIAITKIDNRFYELDEIKKNEVKEALDKAQQDTILLIERIKAENSEKINEAIKKGEALVSDAVNSAKSEVAAEFELEKLNIVKALEAKFKRSIVAKVDEERDGRLARMENVESKFIELAAVSNDLTAFVNRVRLGNQFKLKASTLNSVVNGTDSNSGFGKSFSLETINSSNIGTNGKVIINCRPFVHELQALKDLCDPTMFPASNAAINSDSLLKISAEGVASFPQLTARFEYLAREIKKISLVPEKSGLFSHMSSAVLSKVMFNKHGLVDGNDVEAVLARAEFFLKERDLDLAAREVNQLSGWPKALAEDWLAAARNRLEVEQLLQVC
ncbi:MICOS complex subunit MIC60 [Smittium culicis]|uniref:MICOS complex subunit MIC60 n=1 Tax=Smittium culicis TaxID=133412 RepID=A0A1R1Y8N2_9FUNG|nr:MICOS complex subunit MIC60 [Smittium culicis]